MDEPPNIPPALTMQQQKFIIALLSCPGPTEAAEQVGISRATGYNWLNLPHVKAAYEEAKRDMFSFARERLKQGAALAAETLIDSMQNADKYADRIKAAQIVAGYIPPELPENTSSESGLPGDLLRFLNSDELNQVSGWQANIEAMLELAKERKLEQEQGIKSIHKKVG